MAANRCSQSGFDSTLFSLITYLNGIHLNQLTVCFLAICLYASALDSRLLRT